MVQLVGDLQRRDAMPDGGKRQTALGLRQGALHLRVQTVLHQRCQILDSKRVLLRECGNADLSVPDISKQLQDGKTVLPASLPPEEGTGFFQKDLTLLALGELDR